MEKVRQADIVKQAVATYISTRPIMPRVNLAIVLAGVFLTYRLVANFILNQFYVSGSAGDTYLYSVVFWHCNSSLDVPGIYVRGSYFSMHITWFLWLPCMFSHILPIDRIPYTADVMGVMHAALGLSVMWLLHIIWPTRNVFAVLLKVLAGVLFALNPNAQSVLSQAHVEIAGPVCAAFFLGFLVLNRPVAAVICFILALSVREDMGFHLYGLLTLVMVMDWWRNVPFSTWRTWLNYALAAILYGFIAVMIMNFGKHDYGNLRLVYTGTPPYAHITWETMADRLQVFFSERSWIWLPFIVSIVWSVLSRNYYIMLGYLSTIPWLIFSLTAHSKAASNLSIHYSYPFILAGIWPLIACTPQFRRSRSIEDFSYNKFMVKGAVLLILTQQFSFNISNGQLRFGLDKFLLKVFPIHSAIMAKPALDLLELRMSTSKAELKNLRVDTAVKAIAPYALDKTKYALSMSYVIGELKDVEKFNPPKNIDAIMFYDGNFSGKFFKKLMEVNGLEYKYWLPGTKVRLLTNFDLKEAPSFNQIFLPYVNTAPAKTTQNVKQPEVKKPDPFEFEPQPFYWESPRRK